MGFMGSSTHGDKRRSDGIVEVRSHRCFPAWEVAKPIQARSPLFLVGWLVVCGIAPENRFHELLEFGLNSEVDHVQAGTRRRANRPQRP